MRPRAAYTGLLPDASLESVPDTEPAAPAKQRKSSDRRARVALRT